VAVLIDASILIEAERGRLELESHVRQRQDEEFFLSVITASELLHGVHRAVQAEVRTKRAAFVEGIREQDHRDCRGPLRGCVGKGALTYSPL
jgi:predicted nucleic acid-binding protein